jgi:hypothetical protein
LPTEKESAPDSSVRLRSAREGSRGLLFKSQSAWSQGCSTSFPIDKPSDRTLECAQEADSCG